MWYFMQSPFVTVWLYDKEDPEYIPETRMLIEEVLRQRIQGMESPDGHNINPAFPKLIYCLDDDNIDDPLTKLAAECTAKRMVPDYISAPVMRKYKEGNVYPSMGCRSFLHPWKDEKTGKYKFWGRGNIGVISINLPYLALQSETWEEFLQRVRDMTDKVCAEQKKIYDTISDTPVDVAPIMWMYGAISREKSGTKIGKVIGNMKFSASVGYMGVAESVYRFGVEYVSEKGQQMGLELMQVFNDQVNKNKDKYGIALSIYGTPAESLTDKFAKALKDFPVIKHVNDRSYVTNSYHVPVEHEISEFDKIKFEAPFQKLSPGGCISYVELGDVRKNPEAVMDTIKAIKNDMMYCECNTKSGGVCYKCGYEGAMELHEDGTYSCPNCGNSDSNSLYYVLRMCGYLGSLSNRPNTGRMGDLMNRVDHINLHVDPQQ